MACRCTDVPVGRLLPLTGPMPSWALSVPFSKRRLMRDALSPRLICLFSHNGQVGWNQTPAIRDICDVDIVWTSPSPKE